MALPFIPGNTFNKNLGKVKFHKSHHFDRYESARTHEKVDMLVGETKPGIGGERLPFQVSEPQHSFIPRGSSGAPDMPSWLAFDKHVLAFEAFFQEGVEESRLEQYLIRKVRLYFYLEDDSIQIVEPRLRNSGMPQGTLMKRHRVRKPPPNDSEFYRVEDLNIGAEINIYSRVYKLIACDEFTSNFLTKLGFRLNPSIQAPDDSYAEHRRAEEERMNPKRPYVKVDSRNQYLTHNRHVLRFYAYWDDSEEMFGDVHDLVVHYFLEDDTVEIIEQLLPNSGRDAFPFFMKRARLPKCVELPKLGGDAPKTVLNVISICSHSKSAQTYITDPHNMGASQQDCYKDNDLTIGTTMNAWGRKLVIYDCDEFTKEYYRVKYGITDFSPLTRPKKAELEIKREIPPYNGYGTEEDSLGYCLSILPKAPQRDFVKFMAYDRRGFDSNVLRFLAKIDTEDPTQMDRRFIISYFRTDDTLSIHEPPVRNSGHCGGKFLARGRVKKPNQERYGAEFSKYYGLNDFFVGAKLTINTHRFLLLDADEYVLNYFEKHIKDCNQSDVQRIFDFLRPIIEPLIPEIKQRYNFQSAIPFKTFCSIMCSISGGKLSDHDLLTLGRRYQVAQEADRPITWILVQIQAHLKRSAFDNFGAIVDNCIHQDGARTGLLEKHTVHSVLKAAKVPLTQEMLSSLLERSARSSDGLIKYVDLVESINWCRNPLPHAEYMPGRFDSNWVGGPTNPDITQINNVDINALLNDVIGHDVMGTSPPRPPSPQKCCEV